MHGEHPANFGPAAAVLLSWQHPCLEAKHPSSFGLAVVVVCPGFGLGVFFVGAGVVVGIGVVVGTGQSSLSFPFEADTPSGQQPNSESLQSSLGQPLPWTPLAGVRPSGQQLYLVSLQVSWNSQPSPNGPVAAVLLSGQHPKLDTKHAAGFFGRGLHFFGLSSVRIAVENSVSSSYSVVSVELQMSKSELVVLSPVSVSSVASEAVDSSVPVDSVASVTDSSVELVSTVASLSVVSVPLVSLVSLASVVSVLSVLSASAALDDSEVSSELLVISSETSVLSSVL